MEDSWDTLVMISNSGALQGIIVLYWFSILTYNVSAMYVTKALSGVQRCMIEAARTACIWAVNLVLYYYVTDGKFGEHWDQYS